MSRWATDPKEIPHSETTSAPSRGRRGGSAKLLAGFAPFFLGAAFFLSAFFAVFSPMPILFLYFAKGRPLAALGALSNLAIVFLAGGRLNAFAFAILGIVVAFALGELLLRGFKLEKVVLGTLAAMLLVMAIALAAFKTSIPAQIDQRTRQAVDLVLSAQPPGSAPAIAPGSEEAETLRAEVVAGLPSALAIFALVLVVANAVLCLRLDLRGIRKGLGLPVDFARHWRAPEFLVWPTIVAGAASLWLDGNSGSIAIGCLRLLLAVYCLQGLSILGFFFEAWGLRPILRWLGFAGAAFFMMPFVLSLGFFDLWFNFRSRFKPANS